MLPIFNAVFYRPISNGMVWTMIFIFRFQRLVSIIDFSVLEKKGKISSSEFNLLIFAGPYLARSEAQRCKKGCKKICPISSSFSFFRSNQTASCCGSCAVEKLPGNSLERRQLAFLSALRFLRASS